MRAQFHRGLRFVTHATRWIKQTIRIAIDTEGVSCRLPRYALSLVNKWREAERDFADELGRMPTQAEVAKVLNLTAKKTAIALNALEAVNANLAAHSASYDRTDESALGEALAYTQDDQFDAEDAERLDYRLAQLTEREEAVMRMRFGLEPFAPMTLQEVGDTLGFTRERIRQIEQLALRKLRAAMDAD